MESITFHAALPLLFHGIASGNSITANSLFFDIHLPFWTAPYGAVLFLLRKHFLHASHYINTAAALLLPPCLSALFKITLYKASRIRLLYLTYLFGCALRNNRAPFISSLRTYINDIICRLNHVQIMLDYNYGIPSI